MKVRISRDGNFLKKVEESSKGFSYLIKIIKYSKFCKHGFNFFLSIIFVCREFMKRKEILPWIQLKLRC